MRPSVHTDILYITSHNFLNAFLTTREATHFLKHTVQKPTLKTIINCILPTNFAVLVALFCTENVVENFSHVAPVRPTIDRLVTQPEETGSVCACVRERVYVRV